MYGYVVSRTSGHFYGVINIIVSLFFEYSADCQVLKMFYSEIGKIWSYEMYQPSKRILVSQLLLTLGLAVNVNLRNFSKIIFRS